MTKVTLIGGPTALIGIDGLTILTDPTFDAPGEYPIPGGGLVKQSGPAIAASSLPSIDVVVLSHAHHPDNLDTAGAAVVGSAGTVIGDAMAKDQIGHATALAPWESTTVTGSTGSDVTITLSAPADLAVSPATLTFTPANALTPQTVQRFAGRFGPQVAVLHRYCEPWNMTRLPAAYVMAEDQVVVELAGMVAS
jgi:hypothetical protein